MTAKRAYFDCPTGIAGDMAVGALIDLGFPVEEIAARVRALAIPGLSVRAEKTVRGGLAGTKYVVDAGPDREARGLAEITAIVRRAALPPRAEALALDVFGRLAAVEAKMHGIPLEKVHFHEVGAADALADVVGFAIAWTGLSIESAGCSALPWTRGKVETEHGSLPVPAPATVALLEGWTWEPSTLEGELVTPTGAAILTAVARPAAGFSSMTVSRAGYGAGTRELPGRPNLLRIVLGQESASVAASDRGSAEKVTVLEANLDDMSPQLVGALCDSLRAAGALDVWTTPVQMKKGRMGVVLSALAHDAEAYSLATVFFREGSTLGVRLSRMERLVLEREIVPLETPWGTIRVKVARIGAGAAIANIAPEFDDVRAAAARASVPVKIVLAGVTRLAQEKLA